MQNGINRRSFLKALGGLAGVAAAGAFLNREEILSFLDRDKAAEEAGETMGQVTRRYFAPLGQELPMLGFGCMRFPTKFSTSGREIDAELSEKMIDFAYRHGINYFDTAWFYHDGKSESFVGGVLKKYPRESFFLADKMPTPVLTDLSQAKEIFQTQLERCQVAYFDTYMLHSLSSQEAADS